MEEPMPLPPGQVLIGGFPRFGTDATGRPPAVPRDPVIQVRGAVAEGFDVPLGALVGLPRRDLAADFHCVSGWSATDLHWGGVSFASFYRAYVEPALAPGVVVSHLVFRGLDGFRSALTVEDALGEDVLVADHLNGKPLDGDHGAPVRLVSPRQYGYLSTKHLCRVDVHTSEPTHVQRSLVLRLLAPHPRARVAEEERHRYLPPWSLRHVYRLLMRALLRQGARAGGGGGRPEALD
jgi:DMSO/TMAO reductase YedYZ molybdopterin-dependent catalytic subunit